MVRDEGVKINSKKAPFELVGSAGIEPASMNKSNQTTLFMTGTIPPRFTLVGSAGIEPAIFAM